MVNYDDEIENLEDDKEIMRESLPSDSNYNALSRMIFGTSPKLFGVEIAIPRIYGKVSDPEN